MTAITPQADSTHPPVPAGRFLSRVALMALLWLGLNGADWSSWIVGGPVVLAAAWISVQLSTRAPVRWSLRGAAGFARFFLRESLRGGWDVARQALSRELTLAPGILCFPVRLPAGSARLLFCGTISLLPGTAVVAIGETEICVHVLNTAPHVEEELRELERRVAELFRLELAGGERGGHHD